MTIRGRGRMYIRNATNNDWIDIVLTPVYVRDPTNTGWVRLSPNNFYMMNQRSSGWMLIDDKENDMDDPCIGVDYSSDCYGSPTDATMGSGDGTGSGGSKFTVEGGYPVGYDMPDARYASFGMSQITDAYPLGYVIYRPKLHVNETYDPVGLASFEGLGRYSSPNLLNQSVAGRGAKITETCYRCGTTDGVVEILFACYDNNGISVDVYYMGIRVASTCGFHKGRGKLYFNYNPTQNGYEERIMIRVRGEEGAIWSLLVPYIKYPSTQIVAGVTPESISIIGLASIYEGSTTSYSCQLTYSNGSTRLVKPNWGSTSLPTGTTFSSTTGQLSVGAIGQDTPETLTAMYTENGITMNAQKPITLLHRVQAKTMLFGYRKRVTDDATFDGAFLAELTENITTIKADTGTSGEYQIVIPSNTTTTANQVFAYLAVPKSVYGNCYFINTSDGTYGDAGSWDGVRDFGASDEDMSVAFAGGYEYTIDGFTWIIYRNDYPFEDLSIIFNIKTRASSLVSGLM